MRELEESYPNTELGRVLFPSLEAETDVVSAAGIPREDLAVMRRTVDVAMSRAEMRWFAAGDQPQEQVEQPELPRGFWVATAVLGTCIGSGTCWIQQTAGTWATASMLLGIMIFVATAGGIATLGKR